MFVENYNLFAQQAALVIKTIGYKTAFSYPETNGKF